MLELRGVSYRYPGYATQVLRDLDLTIADGEIVGLVGANEAGKSTLCLVASGLAPASIGGRLTGSLLIDGEPMTGRAPHELAERVVAGFQDPATQRSGVAATVFEEVALGPMNLGLAVAQTVGRTRAALAALGIEALAERHPSRLSGGQSQLVALASLLAMRPRHMVLDEPAARLDPAGTNLVAGAIRALAATGAGLLIAEHRTDLLDGLCGRIVVLDGGCVVLDGPAGEVFADDRIEGFGVEPPARIRLARALAARGLDPALIVLDADATPVRGVASPDPAAAPSAPA